VQGGPGSIALTSRVMRRNGSCNFCGGPFRCCVRNIAHAQDADHSFILINDGQSTDLFCLHDVRRLIHFVNIAAPYDALRHDVSGRQTRYVLAVRYSSKSDIPVRNNADEPIIFANRNGANVLLQHLL